MHDDLLPNGLRQNPLKDDAAIKPACVPGPLTITMLVICGWLNVWMLLLSKLYTPTVA